MQGVCEEWRVDALGDRVDECKRSEAAQTAGGASSRLVGYAWKVKLFIGNSKLVKLWIKMISTGF